MNKALFNDLFDLIYFWPITKEQFFNYLVGENESTTNIFPVTEIGQCINRKKTIRSIVGAQEYFKILEKSKDLKLRDLVKSVITTSLEIDEITDNILSRENDILNLYNKHHIDKPAIADRDSKSSIDKFEKIRQNFNKAIDESTDSDDSPKKQAEYLLTHLFTECIKEGIFFAYSKNRQVKSSTIKSTLGRDNEAEQLRDVLSQYHKVILSAPFGMGKTQFINYCLIKWNFKDYYYISYSDNLETTIKKIVFKDDNRNTYTDINEEDLRNDCLSSSLLIIDNIYFSPDISAELKKMSSWSMDIIAVTLNFVPDSDFHPFKLSPLTDSTLQAVFTDICKIDFKDKNQINQFHFTTQRNILMVSLMGHLCKKLEYERSKGVDYPSDTLDYAISKLQTTEKKPDPSRRTKKGLKYKINNKFYHNYNDETMSILGHIRCAYLQLLDYEYENDKAIKKAKGNLRKIMLYLSCFGWSPIPHIFLKEILCFNTEHSQQITDSLYNKDYLTDLSEIGLLTLTDDTVELSPLISLGVIASENLDPSDFDFIVNNLIYFLEHYEQTLSIPYLSDILILFAENLYELVPEKNNPGQVRTSKQFENWQKMIYLIFMYYNQNNAYDFAQRIIKLIKYPKSLIRKHYLLDKSFFSISNNMHMASKFSEIHEQIDQLCDSLKELNNIKKLDMINFITTVSDIFIDGYLYLFVNPVCEKEYIKKYKEYFFTVMDKLIPFIRLNNDSTYIESLDSKRFYYTSTYLFLKKKYLYPKDYYNYRIYNRLNKNINYAIRSLSITIILTGVSAMLLKDVAAFKHNLFPLTNILNDYINNCKLIPYHTFRLCLYAYIIAGMVQNGFISNRLCEIDDCYCSPLMNHENIHSLFNKCNLSKELYIDSIEKIDPILTELESKKTQIKYRR